MSTHYAGIIVHNPTKWKMEPKKIGWPTLYTVRVFFSRSAFFRFLALSFSGVVQIKVDTFFLIAYPNACDDTTWKDFGARSIATEARRPSPDSPTLPSPFKYLRTKGGNIPDLEGSGYGWLVILASGWLAFTRAVPCVLLETVAQKLGAYAQTSQTWLVVSTPLKNISQIGNLPQMGVKIKSI